MSFAGHVHDMIRRDKENRERKKRNAENRKDRLSKFVCKSSAGYSHVSLSALEEVLKNTKEKVRQESDIMAKNVVIFLWVGIIIGVFGIFVLRKMGIL